MPGFYFIKNAMPIIEIKSISKTYRSGLRKTGKKAVMDVTFSVEPGDVFGIIGRNGAGKSSILKMILGFVRPDAGTIHISGKPPFDPESRKHMGYLPENPYFYDHLSAWELIQFSARASGMALPTAKQHSEILLKRVGLFDVRKKKLRSYSKGMTQRAGLCFALVHDPDIIILDEPMSGLDPLGRKMVIDLIHDLKEKGKTVLFCSHILSDVERICDSIAIMDAGRLKTILKKEDIHTGVEDIFLKTIGETGYV